MKPPPSFLQTSCGIIEKCSDDRHKRWSICLLSIASPPPSRVKMIARDQYTLHLRHHRHPLSFLDPLTSPPGRFAAADHRRSFSTSALAEPFYMYKVKHNSKGTFAAAKVIPVKYDEELASTPRYPVLRSPTPPPPPLLLLLLLRLLFLGPLP